MNSEPFTIRIFVVDGDPDGVRLIDRMNWTGVGVVFPRERWLSARKRPELDRTGVYILVGYKDGADDLPTLYIGEGDAVGDRIERHEQSKDFWDRCYAFTTMNVSLNKAHARWLERELIHLATNVGRSKLDNVTAGPEPRLSEAKRADSKAFLREILQVLPITGLHAFEKRPPVATPRVPSGPSANTEIASVEPSSPNPDDVVVVVPAVEEGFKSVFLGEHRWRAIRISFNNRQRIRYIAAYQSQPVSAITHFAPVATIEPYGEDGKFQLIFSGAPVAIGPIPFGDAPIDCSMPSN